MWKWTSAVLIVLLIGSNGWWLYHAIDLAVTEKYQQQEKYETARKISDLRSITEELVRGMPKDQLMAVLRRATPAVEPFEKGGAMHIPFTAFEIDSDGLVTGVR